MVVNALQQLAGLPRGGTALAVAEFGPSYRRATLMQASLAAVGLLTGLAAWWRGASWIVLLAAVLLGSVIPFTLLVYDFAQR